MYEQIKREANERSRTVAYLQKFPEDISSNEEKYWCQIQYLLSRLEIEEEAREEMCEILNQI